MSKAAELAALIGSQTALSNRNLIINGAMQVWQRSTSSTSTGWGYYTADRWNTNLRDGAGTMSQYDMGSQLQPFIYALKTAMTSAATSNPVVQQKVEDSRRFKNQTVTFSFYAKSSKAITVDTTFDLLWANSSNATTTQSNSITTSWQRFTYTVTLPNPSGSYNATYDHLYCRFSLPTSDTYDFYITGVQLEVGEQATPFEHCSYGDELLKCQRYYDNSGLGNGNTVGWTVNAVNTETYHFPYKYATTMIAAPSLTYVAWVEQSFANAVNFQRIGLTGANVYTSADATDTNGYLLGSITADAEL